ncbi:2-oxo acid dehydrogenase subunit E2 [Psychroflexus sp. CAK57W]|uniref:dihydrolipoamide acetyltransferase family protein n=1 Tax=Psychroflexus curvus TaxID=2873595 RepID=UPI001CCFDA96|nr:dihydrolipoamide acetyltransferase family protein [Psychroflexus curvus]MBZ9627419.1 2-oxo acid dehydrogenase subunit E2 [Psychroflexus curvus]MBZ9785924.1 2-oxo acid dehydrogenase subunit E2 [Psychroflexus curvus]
MAKKELKLPKMGESVAEATITSWLKEVGDTIEADEAVLEIATDKVDSEVPSEYDGVLVEKLHEVDAVVKVGEVVAIIEVDGEDDDSTEETESEEGAQTEEVEEAAAEVEQSLTHAKTTAESTSNYSDSSRFYSPLVKNIASKENVTLDELENIKGTGLDERVTKDDILAYVKDKKEGKVTSKQSKPKTSTKEKTPTPQAKAAPAPQVSTPVNVNAEDEVIEMNRMGKLISSHMIASTQTSAHVQSFIEVDVTDIWNWRNKHKDAFQKREGEKLTFTPIFMEAVAKTIKDFPKINISVDGDRIIMKKHINLGMAAALPDGNLIVPVIRDADQLNLLGMAKKVNDLAGRARNGKLKPDETQGGTYTVTNVGTFGSVMGTPIINQPQVGILALGAIRKVPAVIETPEGDFIGIRHKMFLSHSYDHRVVNGALGGQFIQRMKEYLEDFDTERSI